jgi:hypothetical protein
MYAHSNPCAPVTHGAIQTCGRRKLGPRSSVVNSPKSSGIQGGSDAEVDISFFLVTQLLSLEKPMFLRTAKSQCRIAENVPPATSVDTASISAASGRSSLTFADFPRTAP